MPGPPPPPPMGAPPPMMPPPPPTFVPSKGGSDSRGALLQSIRQGTKLKKTITVDKSAPMISGKTSNSNSSANIKLGGSMTSNATTLPVHNGLGLGGLFAGGMPKLKPTGRNIGLASNNVNRSNTNVSSNNGSTNRSPESPAQSQKCFSNIQLELKKQMASDSRNRGPPPPAPTRHINNGDDVTNHSRPTNVTKNGSSSYLHQNASSPSVNASSLHGSNVYTHRKANSNVNLSTPRDNVDSTQNNNLPTKPTVSHGKPNLAPKPPAFNGKPVAPPKKLIINGKAVSRAQSMRSPRTPSPQSPDNNNANYPTKFGTVRNLSSVLNQTLGQSMGNLNQKPRPALNGRPSAPPPSIPQQSIPPPPSKTVKPLHAPPPPPSGPLPQPPQHAPPPPPHRTAPPPQPSRAPPAVPTNAPPPPPRFSSIRDVNTMGKRTYSPTDLEARFADMFHPVHEFPKPGQFRRVPKVYNSKQVVNKQQAPLPPNHVQLNNRLWDSSTC